MSPDKAPSDEAGKALLNMWQARLVEDIERAWPEAPEGVARAAVSWVKGGELNRHYGPGFTIAYSLKHAFPFLLEEERISTNTTMGEMLDKIKRLEALFADEREAQKRLGDLLLQAAKNMEWNAKELKTTSNDREQEIRRSLLADAKHLRVARSSLGSPEEADRG